MEKGGIKMEKGGIKVQHDEHLNKTKIFYEVLLFEHLLFLRWL